MKNKKCITLLLPGLLLGCAVYHGAVSALPDHSLLAVGAASSSNAASLSSESLSGSFDNAVSLSSESNSGSLGSAVSLSSESNSGSLGSAVSLSSESNSESNGNTASLSTDSSDQYSAAYAIETSEDSVLEEAALQEKLKLYEPFGMTYDSDKDELKFHGKLVRWFEDYYPLNDEEQAGYDHFTENGVIDVYTVRDFSSLTRHNDGSYDPSGKIIALKEFSDKEFAKRDINAIKNPPENQAYACEGEPMTKQEAEKTAAEYAAFGVTYDYSSDQWYLNGEKIRYFLDILTSNNKELSSGDFQGSIRSSWNDNGTVDVYTVRDFNKLNDDKNGTLTDIKKYSRKEFDEHTRSN